MKRSLAIALLATSLVGVALAFFLRGERAAPPPVLAELPDFRLTERRGGEVGRAELAGRPFVADFVFTRCRVYCPRLTARMKELAARLPPSPRPRLVSITVDPEHDTPAVLTDYARDWGVEADADWLFLTGETAAVRRLVREGFLLPVEDVPENTAMPILHSSRLMLVDGAGRIRGAYEAFEADALDRLLADLGALGAKPEG
jgi:protein SCO1/2